MPQKAIDYSNCCIYKIEHIDKDDLVYVGHTTNFTKGNINIKVVVIMIINNLNYIK